MHLQVLKTNNIFKGDQNPQESKCHKRSCSNQICFVLICFAILTLFPFYWYYDMLVAYQPQCSNPKQAEQRLPDVIIAGVKKSGTGALIEMLKLHPSIAAPNYGSTENSFFDDTNWSKGVEYWVSKMARGLPDQLIVTKSQSLIENPHKEIIYTKLEVVPVNSRNRLFFRSEYITLCLSGVYLNIFHPRDWSPLYQI